ncbi:MAG TPA: 16S rRNA (guanine(966)-N(2))-methyltransferase RsmD [Thermodesulfovibrionales bacterium]|nr:16S rRNA (guanine(966)-N(2))-methyltransferase RsmD [Thermodesulfovibrionales bacterium]
MIKISGGIAKGRRIGVKKAFAKKTGHDELRPTSSKVREALFDILRNELPGSSFLDLYAGTGGVGIEAMSRGAVEVVFVESNTIRAGMIRQILGRLHFMEHSKVIEGNALEFVRREGMREHRYDIVYLDPPYHSEELTEMLPLLGEGRILKEGGVVVVEHFSKTDMPEGIKWLTLRKRYKYGDTSLTAYTLKKGGPEQSTDYLGNKA